MQQLGAAGPREGEEGANMRLKAILHFLCVGLGIALNRSSLAQINIDVGGNGSSLPSSSFGGAAGQPGYWNSVTGATHGTVRLRGTSGRWLPSYIEIVSNAGTGARYQTGQIGDFAALFNDACQAWPYTLIRISKLRAGTYDVYSYGWTSYAGYVSSTDITVAGITRPIVLPMPLNAFLEGRTHVVHRVTLRNHEQLEVLIQSTPMFTGGAISGLQVVRAGKN